MATLSDLYIHLKTLCEQWFYNKNQIDTKLTDKVDKETGKGLSTNDYTTSEKTKLAGIEAEANKTVVDAALSSSSTNPVQNKIINTALSNKADNSSLPTKTSDLTNDGADGTNIYVSDNDSRLSDARTPTSHSHGHISSDGKVTNTISFSTSLRPIVKNGSGELFSSEVSTDYIKDNTAHSNIGTSALSTQTAINTAIDTAIGNLSQIHAIEVVTTKPTASASTMGKLYIVSENSKINVYYTIRNGTDPNYTYSWQKMDADILDELSIDWTDIENNPFSSSTPSSFATNNHSHGNITNDGTIGNQPEKPLITGVSGVIEVGSFGTTAGTFCQGNDSRLSNARTPTSHTHGNISNDGKVGSNANYFVYTTTGGAITSKQKIGNITTSGAIGSTANKPIITGTSGALTTGSFGTSANTFAEGNHTHGNFTNDGKISTTGTSGGNIVITTSANDVAVDTTINVIDALVQDLISYGSS